MAMWIFMRRSCVRAFSVAWASCGLLLLLLGCQSTAREEPAPRVRFHLENSHATSRAGLVPLTMPLSGAQVTINAVPALMETDIINVELVEVELGRCLLFQFNRVGARALYELTVAHGGQRLVLMVDGVPVGVRVIDAPETRGQWLTFTELSDPALEALVRRLQPHWRAS